MIAYASNLTNGHCNYIYREPLLTEQAEWERLRPVKPILDNLFQGKLHWLQLSKVGRYSLFLL